jgi:hypothetical protein
VSSVNMCALVLRIQRWMRSMFFFVTIYGLMSHLWFIKQWKGAKVIELSTSSQGYRISQSLDQ